MSSQMNKSPVRGYRRWKTPLNLNLNTELATENRNQEGTSNQVTAPQLEASLQEQAGFHATIDIEALDDDVAICSPTDFAEAKRKAQRNQGRNDVVDVESDELAIRLDSMNHKRRRGAIVTHQEIVFNDLYINLDRNNKSLREPAVKPVSLPPPPPKEPTFSCPICMGPFVEETSTRCGHIFCKECIRTAISAQAKCPTCRKRVVMKELIRVFLPSAKS